MKLSPPLRGPFTRSGVIALVLVLYGIGLQVFFFLAYTARVQIPWPTQGLFGKRIEFVGASPFVSDILFQLVMISGFIALLIGVLSATRIIFRKTPCDGNKGIAIGALVLGSLPLLFGVYYVFVVLGDILFGLGIY